MSESNDKKTYYFLKVPENFFSDKVMKRLRRLPGGDVYTIVALKILLLGLKDDNRVYYDGVGIDFADEIAIAIDEQSEAVQVTISYLLQCGWLEQVSDTEIFSAKSAELVGSIKACSLRKRKSRALKCDNVTQMSHQSHAELEIDIELEKELDIEIDKEESNSLRSLSSSCPEPSSKTPEPEPVFITIPTNKNGEDFSVTQTFVGAMKELYPNVDVESQIRSMKAWAISNPSKRKTKQGMTRFINSWLAREQNKGGSGKDVRRTAINKDYTGQYDNIEWEEA